MIPAETMQTFRFALENNERAVAERIRDAFATCQCHHCKRDVSVLNQMLDAHFAQPDRLPLETPKSAPAPAPSTDDIAEALDRR